MKGVKKRMKMNWKRLLAALIVVVMVGGYIPTSLGGNVAAAALETTKIADPNTATRAVDLFAGTTMNAGRVMVGKTVDTDEVDYSGEAKGANWLASSPTNFLVTISQAAQAMGVSSEIPVPIDAVFVLDTSGSMAYDIDSTQENGVAWADQRATHMVAAANDAIASLMAANSLNRVAVVAFSDSTTTLSTLYHYTGTAATSHLTWDGNRIVGRDTDGTTGSSRNGKSGGTNIHAGIAAGAKILAEAENTTVTIGDKEVTRIPFLIVLSDGAPTYSGSSTDWTNPSGIQGPGGSVYVGNGFLPVLTASYYKNVISKNYFGDNVTESNRAYMYTIGIGVDGLSNDEKALALLTLNPKDNMNSQNSYYENSTNHDFKYYWEQYQADKTFEILVNNNDMYTIGQGSYWENQKENRRDPDNWVEVFYDNHQPSVTSLLYNDNYYSANNATGLQDAFRQIVVEIQKRAITYPTQTDVDMTADFSGYVTFRDVIGEYMEVKGMKGIIADGTLFQGAAFAYYMNMTREEVHADADATAFMQDLIHSMEVRFGLRTPEETDLTHASMDDFLNDAWNWAHDRDQDGNAYTDGTTNPRTQMYYNSSTDFDNSICWWGHTATDGTVQMLGWAADDSIQYIETAKEMAANGEAYRKAVGTAVAEGADYVARSYFFYGTAGGTVEQEREYLDFSVTVMRELEAPYTQTVVISAPASLLSMQRVLIYDTDKSGEVTAYFDEVIPTRVVYEVGLREDITAESAESILSEEYKAANKVDGGYVFYTNEWLRNPAEGEAKALTSATFNAESTNAYYVFDTNTPIYVKDGENYVKYTGTEQPSGEGYYYAHEYYTLDENATAAQGAAGVKCSKVQIEYIEMNIPIPENTTQVKWDSTQGCWVILAGTFKAQSLVESGIEEKTQNLTGTGEHIAHPIRTGGETDPHYTVYLGNNGKLTFVTADAKSVFNANGDDIDGMAAMVDQELTYRVKVTNTKDVPADATIVDTIPSGTELVADSVTVYKGESVLTGGYSFVQSGDVLTWSFENIAAGSTYTAEFKVKVTPEALDISVVSNQATVTLDGNSYKTNLVSNPIEGKKATGATSTVVPADGVQVGNQIVYTIQYYNDTASTSDVKIVDRIPAGTAYVDGSATNGGALTNGVLNWTIEDVAAGTGGSVSFKVEVTAAALTVNPFTNVATIQIGTNAPVQNTNEVQINVKIGDLVLSKVVETGDDDGLNPKTDQEFVLVLTETSGVLKDAKEEFALVDESGNPIKDSENKEIKVTFDANSQAKITIKAGQTLVVKGMPVGVTVVVTEEPVAGYTPVYAPGNSVTIVENNITTPAVSVKVTNTYAPDPYHASTLFTFTKTLVSNGAALKDKSFAFVAHLADENGNLAHDEHSVIYGTVTVDSGESKVGIAFDALNIGKTGTYHYLVTEAVGSDGGIYYDPTEFLLSFNVVDSGSGKLELEEGSVTLRARANVDREWTAEADWDFENIYTPAPTGVVLEANKVLNNRVLEDEFFTFEVVDTKNNDKVVATAKNKADGSITFPEIQFTAAGEYVYRIYEVNGGRKNYTYDTKTYTVTVVVTDDGEGNLAVSTINGVAADGFDFSAIKFENTYIPVSATATVQATKNLVGRAQIGGEFAFTLSGGNLAAALTAENDTNGNVAFPAISYTLADIGYPAVTSKTFTYTIAEVKGSDENIGYTDKTLTVNVTVSYNDVTGEMKAAVEYPDGQTLTNTYTPDPIPVIPAGTKVTDNYASADANTTFTFNIVNADREVLLSGTSGLMGQITYTDGAKVLEYDHNEVGTHNYWIVEQNDGKSGITYDGTIYLMQVTVSQHSVTGVLSAEVKYCEVSAVGDTSTAVPAADASFRNSYAATGTLTIAAEKILSGRELNDGEFRFVLKDANGTPIGSAVKADANGLITFPTIQLTAAGDFVYYATEVIPADEDKLGGVDYDTNTYAIHVSVVDTGNGAYVGTVTDVQVKAADSDTYVSTGLKSVVFNNTYATGKATITLEALKEVIGHAYTMKGGEFSFEVRNAAGIVVARGTNDAEGVVTFSEIEYTFADYLNSDTYVYTITEDSDVPDGFSHDATAHTVTVKLTDDGAGNLTATATYPADGAVFTNTYAPASTTAQITAQKILDGRMLADGEFWFVLEDEDGNQIVASNSGKNVTFREITYTEAGTYTYTVREVSGVLGGVDYDDASYEVTVEVTDKDGYLQAEVTYPEGGVVFENTYQAAPASYRLAVKKSLTGRWMNADEFRFEMKDQSGTVVSVAYNASTMDDGIALFNAIEYTEAGTYTYTVYEKKGDLSGITYDEAVYTVEITVTDDGDGQLHAAVTKVNETVYADGGQYNPADITFKNTYKPAPVTITMGAEGTVDISKVLNGRPLAGGEFTFELTGSELSEPLYASNDADGKIVFAPISYDSTGVRVYTIKEMDNGLGGVTYTAKSYMVVVEVSDNSKGQLIATIVYVAEVENGVEKAVQEIVFENEYKTGNAEITLEADKAVVGHYFDIDAEDFHFVVKNLAGNVVAEGTNAATVGNEQIVSILFEKMVYTFEDYVNSADADHTFTYIISESASGIDGMADDKSEFIVTVKLTDDGKGNLSAEAAYPAGGVTFKNTYTPEPTYIQLEADKALEVLAGTTVLEDGQFSFYLAEKLASGKYLLVENKGNNAAGNVIFSAIKYTEAGVYTYAIGENAGTNKGVTYDSNWYEVIVEVTDDAGALTAAVVGLTLVKGDERISLEPDTAMEFVNIYKAAPTTVEIEASKNLAGKEIETDEFSFLLESVGDVFEDMIAKNGADGKIVFPVEFTEAGVYEFLLTEQAGDDVHVTYDGSEYKVTVTVTDDGLGQLHAQVEYKTADNRAPVFSNTYTPDAIKVVIEGTKKLTGKALTDGLFIFRLLEDGSEVATGTNTADGKFTIELELGETGEYLYEVVEKDTKAGGVTYDTASWTVKVIVTAKDSGELEAAVEYVDGDIVFENSYDPQDCPVVITALKNLTGKDLEKGAYEFEITEFNEVTGKYEVRATGKNDADGTIIFSEIVHDKTGTFYYVVSEVQGDESGVAYDQTEYDIRVDVRDEDGVLKYEVTYLDGALVFTNIYRANSVDVEVGAAKELAGKKLTDGEFTFRLTDASGNDVVAPVSNDASGKITFRVNVDKAGTYHWTISEVAGKDGHITYDEQVYDVTVVVTDNTELAQLIATVEYGTSDEKAPVFKNTYTPDPVSVDLTLEGMIKELIGRKLVDGEFFFEVKDAEGNVVSGGKNDIDGNIIFDKKLEFTEKGEYTYTVYEVAGDDDKVTYDEAKYTMKVTVTDDGEGTLTAEVTYGEDGEGDVPVFENTYTPDELEVVLEALKTLNGRELTDGEFSFEVKDAGGNVVAKGKNDADGKIVFDSIKLGAGEYTFIVYEVIGDAEDTIYDKTEFEVTVKVADTDGDGVLEEETTYPDSGVEFVNEHYEEVYTGDSSQMVLWIAIAVLCVVAVGAVIVIRKKYK